MADEIKNRSRMRVPCGSVGTLWSGAGNSVDQAQSKGSWKGSPYSRERCLRRSRGRGCKDYLELESAEPNDRCGSAAGALAVVQPSRSQRRLRSRRALETQARIDESISVRDQVMAQSVDTVQADRCELLGLRRDANLLSSAPPAALPEITNLRPATPVSASVRARTSSISIPPLPAPNKVISAPRRLPIPNSPICRMICSTWCTSRSIWIPARATCWRPARSSISRFAARIWSGPISSSRIDPQSFAAIGYSLQAALEGTVNYWAVLGVGGRRFRDQRQFDCRVAAARRTSSLEMKDAKAVGEGEAIAERLEIEVISPGRIRRARHGRSSDRVADQRQAEAIDFDKAVPFEKIDLGDGIEGFLPIESVFAFSSLVSRVPESFLRPAEKDDIAFREYGGVVHTLHAVRQRLEAATAGVTFLDRPNFTGVSMKPSVNPTGGTPGVSIQADLIVQGYGGAAVSGGAARIRAGVVAQAAEEVFVNRPLLSALYDQGLLPSKADAGDPSAGEVFRAAADQSIPSVVLNGASDPSLAAIGLDDTSRALVADHLMAGRAVIIPRADVMIDSTPTRAWWVYDPASGMFWDQLPDGRSGSAVLFGPMADYAIELWTFTKTLKGFLLLGCVCVPDRRAWARCSTE